MFLITSLPERVTRHCQEDLTLMLPVLGERRDERTAKVCVMDAVPRPAQRQQQRGTGVSPGTCV